MPAIYIYKNLALSFCNTYCLFQKSDEIVKCWIEKHDVARVQVLNPFQHLYYLWIISKAVCRSRIYGHFALHYHTIR